MDLSFVSVVGYILGALVVFVIAGICLKPIKTIIKLMTNCVLGGVMLLLINLFGSHFGIHIGVNPITSVAVGLLGVPGVIGLLLLQIFF